MNQDKVKQNWTERDFSFGLWVDPPGQVWEGYVHGVDELFMVVEGEVELEMKGEVLHPKVGEEVLIPANVVHSVRNLGDQESRWFYGYRRGS